MPVVKLTDQFLKTAKPIAGEVTTRYFDSKWTGLCARVGAKAVTFYAQAGGRMHKFGHWPKWTVDEARKECQAIQVKVDRGEDPTGARQNLPTLAEAFEDFAKVRLAKRRPKTAREYRRQLQIYLFPKWGKRQVNQLTRADVVRLHAELTRAGKPTRANRVVATISSLYGWLQRDAGLDVANPAARIERNQEHGREHFLDAQQVAGLRAALEDYAQKLGGRSRGNDIAADCILFCIATGCRSGEARTATWDQFDEALTVWSKPASTTKQRKKHRSPIGPAAQAVLLRRRGLRRTGETSVFPSRSGRPIDLRNAWAKASEAAGLSGTRLHDMRHTFASLAVSAGVPLRTIGGLLGHSAVQTTARYAHLLDADLQAAASKVNALIDGNGRRGDGPAE